MQGTRRRVTAKDVETVVSDGNASASDICTGKIAQLCAKYGVK